MKTSVLAALTTATAILAAGMRTEPAGDDDVHGEENTYDLPQGEPLRQDLAKWFRRQEEEILSSLPDEGELPEQMPPIGDSEEMAEHMTPTLEVWWDASGKETMTRLGLDPDNWKVTNPHLKHQIQHQALAFCDSTNQTTSKRLDVALKQLRKSLIEGMVTKGEALPQLRERVSTIFEGMSRSKAAQIAATEASRATHLAQLEADHQSEVVAGVELLLSSGACPLCRKIATEAPRVKLGQSFAVIGSNPVYRQIKSPPLHPHCQCAMVEVLLPEYGGPADVEWSETLDQPQKALTGEQKEYKPPADKEVPQPRPKAKEELKVAPVRKPIADRLKEYTEGDRKVAELAKIKSELAQAEAERKTAQDAFNAAHLAVKAAGSDAEAAKLERAKRFQTLKETGEKLDRLKASERERALEVLRIPPDQRMKIISPKKGEPMDRYTGQLKLEADKGLAWLGEVLAHGPQPSILMTEGKLVPKNKPQRACANYGTIFMVPTSRAHTVVHELGHNVEFQHCLSSAKEFLAHRVGNEAPTQLKKIFPERKYRSDEFGRKDHFDRFMSLNEAYYTGKDYKGYCTEVVSMGLQKLYEDPAGFASKDPEYAKFICGILDGSLR